MTRKEFKILFDTHFETVRRYIYYKIGDEEKATDIAQETFMKVWEKQLQPEKGKEIALLYRMASNKAISDIRKEKSAMTYKGALVIDREEHTPEKAMEYTQLQEKYNQALISLTDKQRTVFLLSRVEEMSYKDMALQLNISVKAIEKRMSQALAALRQALDTQ